VRVNAADTPWHEGYLAAVQRLPIAAIIVPNAERPEPLRRIAAMVQHVPT
jgi:citrate lyase subunit beta/citryl-CoA lyase